MKCRYNKPYDNDIAISTLTLLNSDGSVLKEDATFEQIFKKENLISIILEAATHNSELNN